MSSHVVTEVVIFKIKEGISDTEYLEAVAGTQRFLAKVGGSLDRKLFRNEEGQWMDLVYWESLDKAMAAAEQFPHSPDCQPMMSLLDEESVQMWHFHAVDIPTPTT